MRTKIALLTSLSLLVFGLANAQQLPQFSQYMNNAYVINPAASSLTHDIDLNIGFRQQWAGFDGAPQTYYVGGTINLGKRSGPPGKLYSIPISQPAMLKQKPSVRYGKHVVGGLIARDEYGVFERTSVMGSYSYHHPIGEKYWLAGGLSLGWYGLTFDRNSIILENDFDNTYFDFIANGSNSNIFDINAGLYFYGDRIFAGYSVYQLGQNEINLGNEDSPLNLSEARLEMHHFINAGYRITVSDKIDLTPSFMVKVRPPSPLSVDINVMAAWDQKFRLGLSYRNEDAVSVILGANLTDFMRLAYAYDYVTSDINDISSGSHEIVLGFLFNRKNNK
ncbi:MAG: type IX secretion system membrane protein PorP/SprF [Bacteroidota bacterium]